MNSTVIARFSAILGVTTSRTTCARLTLARFYAAKKGENACAFSDGVIWHSNSHTKFQKKEIVKESVVSHIIRDL